MFFGRDHEMKQLHRIAKLPKASLVICRGRRRIGKSTLIENFAGDFPHFYEFQGLAPRQQLSNSDQLDNFSNQLRSQLNLPPLHLRDWNEAFALLARLTEKNRVLVFLDEISWMAAKDKDFVGQLKIAWDTLFKNNPQLMMVLCGSVSSWIDYNILNSADFMGRVSLSIDLRELPLADCNQFWNSASGEVSVLEKFRILAVTGGVPRYLEEIDYSATAEQNIKDLCFRKEGILFNEFEKIFNDIFQKRSAMYRRVVNTLTDGPRTFSEICQALSISPNGVITKYLMELESSGFICRDYVYSPRSGKRGKLSRYRLKDNYLRFYLKYIEPVRDKIEAGIYDEMPGIPEFLSYDSILGLQFENLVLNNLPQVLKLLRIDPAQVISASPYFQNQTKRKHGCQIDLLIDARYATYVCEIKFRQRITTAVIEEVDKKAKNLESDSGKSLRKVLIYAGELAPGIEKSGAFDRLIPFGDFLLPR